MRILFKHDGHVFNFKTRTHSRRTVILGVQKKNRVEPKIYGLAEVIYFRSVPCIDEICK